MTGTQLPTELSHSHVTLYAYSLRCPDTHSIVIHFISSCLLFNLDLLFGKHFCHLQAQLCMNDNLVNAYEAGSTNFTVGLLSLFQCLLTPPALAMAQIHILESASQPAQSHSQSMLNIPHMNGGEQTSK